MRAPFQGLDRATWNQLLRNKIILDPLDPNAGRNERSREVGDGGGDRRGQVRREGRRRENIRKEKGDQRKHVRRNEKPKGLIRRRRWERRGHIRREEGGQECIGLKKMED